MSINEENFILHLKNKNEKALHYVIDSYGYIIKSIVKKHLYNLEKIQEECINDVLLAVWYHIDSFNKDKNSFQNWIAAISKYKCIDYKRKYLKLLEEQDIDNQCIESSFIVEMEVIKNDFSEEMTSLLSNLKATDRELFIKHYAEQKDINIISKEMGIKTSAIYNRLSRGRSKLRAILETENK
jgi:RNA polymerase sigma-70 factor, ECF subfamily